ncbi:phosphotransferase enzyme family protein [Arthrobacter sp. CDRTa11]|uniref:phosphotransferase enzyme family protein n=1 Tax=Arthrobacter sp. CDRTa11 TaxID=2651199 RepID=UPI002265E809|nr:phosphotransferase [Arthrobacter sp. CDRTa11]
MPLSEIRRIKESVDPEWRSTVADDVASAWGLDPGTARWWRSSASHVFVVPGAPRRFLRFVPADTEAARRFRQGAELATDFPHVDGLWVARPLPSGSGDRVPTVDTSFGPMSAMLVEEAPGITLDVQSLTPARAREWGQALARFHAAAPRIDSTEPHIYSDEGLLAGPLAHLHGLLGSSEPTHRQMTMHGDFELDNLRFSDAGVAIFDFDESGYGPAACDIALATRALHGEEGADPEPELYAEFLIGYRSQNGFTEEEEAAVETYSLHHSARRAQDCSILDEGFRPSDPLWQQELHDEILAGNAWHRSKVMSAVRELGHDADFFELEH